MSKNPYYDTTEFKLRWMKGEPIKSIAASLGVCESSVFKAVRRRGLPKRKKTLTEYYNSPAFRARWYSRETLEEIALDLGVEANSVWQAAMRRGFVHKKTARNETRNS